MADQSYPASSKECFDVLYKSLVDYSDKFVSRLLSVIGFQLVGIGWVLTSQPAREFFRSSETGTNGAIIISIMLALSFPPSIARVWRAHRHSAELLEGLAYMPKTYYEQHLLPPWYLPTAIAIVLLECAALAILIVHWHWDVL